MNRWKKSLAVSCLSLIISGCSAKYVALNKRDLENPQKVLLVVNDVSKSPTVLIGTNSMGALAMFGLIGGVIGETINAGRSRDLRSKLDGWRVAEAAEKEFLAFFQPPTSWQIVKLSHFDADMRPKILAALKEQPAGDQKKMPHSEIGKRKPVERDVALQSLQDAQITRVLWIDVFSYGIMDDPKTAIPTYNVNARGRLFDPEKKDLALWQRDIKSQSLLKDKKAARVNFELELAKEPTKIVEQLTLHSKLAMENLTSDFIAPAHAAALQ